MIKTSMIAIVTVLGFYGVANAMPAANEATLTSNTMIIARHGADDPKGDDRGGKGRGRDDGAGHTSIDSGDVLIQLARRGADDPKGDDRGGKGRGRGKDDGVGHG